MDLPLELSEQMQALQSSLDALDDFLQPFLHITPKEMDSALAPLESARAHLALAQAACLLFRMHLQLHGQRPEEHPVHKDQERLALYAKKVRKAAARTELALSRPAASLDVAAANRFINAAIPELNAEQKQQLKQLGAAADKQRREGKAKGQRGGCGSSSKAAGKQPAAPPSLLEEAADMLQAALAGEEEKDEEAAAVGGGAGGSATDPANSAAQPAAFTPSKGQKKHIDAE